LLFLLSLSISVHAQTKLYDDFSFKMSKKEAFTLLKKDKKKFNNLRLGPNNVFILKKGSLIFEDDELIHITIWNKSILDVKKTEKLLKTSKNHLESKGFQMVYAQPNWENPLFKEKNKPYLRMIQKEKKILAEIEPRGQGENYTVFLSYYDLDWFHQKINEL
jgi:hypothetical protein